MKKPEKTDVDRFYYVVKQGVDRGMRIGQVIDNIFSLAAQDGYDPFYISNGKLMFYAHKFAKQY